MFSRKPLPQQSWRWNIPQPETVLRYFHRVSQGAQPPSQIVMDARVQRLAHLKHFSIAHREGLISLRVDGDVRDQHMHVQRGIFRLRCFMYECRSQHLASSSRRLRIVQFSTSIPTTGKALEPLQFLFNRCRHLYCDSWIINGRDTDGFWSRVCNSIAWRSDFRGRFLPLNEPYPIWRTLGTLDLL